MNILYVGLLFGKSVIEWMTETSAGCGNSFLSVRLIKALQSLKYHPLTSIYKMC